MKKLFAISLLILILFSSSNLAYAGRLNFGAKASIYNPTISGASPTLMYGIVADYEVNPMIHARGTIEYTTYTVNNIGHSLMPVTLNIIAHFMPGTPIDPYLGGGAGYYKYVAGSDETSTIGLQAIGGIRISLGAFYAAFETSYYIPDASETGEGSLSYGGNMTGWYGVSIPF